MESNYQERLDAIRSTVEEQKVKQARLQAKKEQLEKSQQEIVSELASEELTPDKLQSTIATLDKEVAEKLIKLEEQVGI
jgi:signal-transduction protein with cAMP-binding, CBS, and nucleotidyltransferase domain